MGLVCYYCYLQCVRWIGWTTSNGGWDYISRVGKIAVGYQRYNDCTFG